MTHYGIDVSNYQGPISPVEALALKQAGVDFAYVLATDGTGFRNPDAPGQCAALRSAGIYVGLYHFYEVNGTNADQILDFITMAHACGGTSLPLALDMERADSLGWADLASRGASFARQIAAVQTDVTNSHALIYCNGSFADNLPGVPWGNWLWFADPSNSQPNRPRLITQKAPRPVASLPSVDFDEFTGTDAQWEAFVGSQAPPGGSPAPPVNSVPGPGGVQLSVIGRMVNGTGLYEGRGALDGIPVFAGLGNPTVWYTNFNPKTLPAGTPLAVAVTDLDKVTTTVAQEQL